MFQSHGVIKSKKNATKRKSKLIGLDKNEKKESCIINSSTNAALG